MERRSFVGKLTLGLSAAISAPFIAWFKNDKQEKNTPKRGQSPSIRFNRSIELKLTSCVGAKHKTRNKEEE